MTRYLEVVNPEIVQEFIRDWVATLSLGRYEEAYDWLIGTEDFTPNLIRERIYEWLPEYDRLSKSEKKRFTDAVVSDPRIAQGTERYYFDLQEWPDSEGRPIYGIEYHLPIRGEFSSIRADFFLRDIGDGRYALELVGIAGT